MTRVSARSAGEMPCSRAPLVAVGAPEYFPRLGYAALMQAADRFIVMDTWQYVRQSYQNRSRLRTPDGWQWITVPLRRRQHGLSHARTLIAPEPGWRRRHWRSLLYNYGRSPFFDHFAERVRALLFAPGTSLTDLTYASIRFIHASFGMDSAVERSSDAAADSAEILDSISPRCLLSTREQARRMRACDPLVLIFDHGSYRQPHAGFEAGMSALDLLFGYGPEAPSMLKDMVTISRLEGARRP